MAKRVALVSESGKITEDWLQLLASSQEVLQVRLTAAGLDRLRAEKPDLVILDTRPLPEFPEQRARELRALFRGPVLVLGPESNEGYAVRALKLGADGYLAAPIGKAELQARVEAHLRRYWDWDGRSGEFAQEPLRMACANQDNCTVTLRSRTVKLSPTECRLLTRLAQEPGQAVGREELSSFLWGQRDGPGNEGMVSLYIHYLRKKLEEDPRYPRYIRTKRGGGYYLMPEGN